MANWLSRDPLPNAELLQGPNLYSYVANDPVNLVDPYGLCPLEFPETKEEWQRLKEEYQRNAYWSLFIGNASMMASWYSTNTISLYANLMIASGAYGVSVGSALGYVGASVGQHFAPE